MGLGLRYLGGPLGFHRLPRDEQALALGWYCAEHLPAGWRAPNRRARGGRLVRQVDATTAGRAFWLGG